MSASGNGEVLRPILLRSMTPGPNEKVLKYLDDMDREGNRPDNRPPRSIIDPEEFPSQVASPRSQAQSMRTPGQRSEGLPKSPLIYTNGAQTNGNDHVDDDIASDIQEGTRSELGEEDVHREPGPNDPPGPKYESYDSGPSFGNFGPLPSEDRGPSSNPFQNGTWNPGWGQGKPQDAVSANGTTPGFAAAKSPRAGSRAGKGSERPFSPMSARSGKNTVYPPLPESRIGDEETMGVGSPMARSVMGRSKAPSISPSDSASHMKSPAMTRKNMTKSPGPSQLGSSAEVPKSNGRSQPGSVMSAGGNHQNRPFSPYRHAPTNEDLLYAAVRGRAMAIPEEDEQKASTVGPQSPVRTKSAVSQVSKAPSQTNGHGNGHAVASPKSVSSVATPKPPTVRSTRSSGGSQKAPSAVGSQVRQQTQTPTRTPSLLANGSGELQLHAEGDATPRARSPDEFELNREEARIVNDALMASRTPRTSYIGTNYEPDAANAYHDHELCVLLHQESDPAVHELVKKALRKAIKQRVKRLGMKYDNESIRQIKRTHHDHDPSIYGGGRSEEPPQWATDLKRELVLMQQRVESLGPKIDNLQIRTSNSVGNESRFMYDDDVTRTPQTQTVNIQTQHTGTAANSMYQGAQHEITLEDGEDFEDGMTATPRQAMTDDTQSPLSPYPENQDDSTGQQILEEEMYRLRQRPRSQSRASHNSWEVAREQHLDDFEEGPSADQLPDIPDADGEERSLPALPEEEDHDDGDDGEGDEEGGVVAHHGGMVTTAQGPWTAVDVVEDPQNTLTPWQRVQQRLLQWAVVWPMSEIDGALNSTTRGNQVDEVALSIWSMQTYKRYVRQRLTDNPQGVVDRLFVPPNMADAISNAVFNGQHGNACAMLRELWAPFGLPGMPRLLVVLAKHRSEADHWVVHRYSLPDGTLVTYDSFPGRTLMDGRPLGWWFAIRIAWPNANYPAPDHLEQKMVRLHRPLQLPIDNSVAAAGIWRNILMGSRGERSLDLERLRDLINTEVKNLRQRKQLGRLSIAPPNQAAWGSPL